MSLKGKSTAMCTLAALMREQSHEAMRITLPH